MFAGVQDKAVRVVRGGDPVLRQRPLHVIRNNSRQLGVAYGILLGKQESQELQTQNDTVRLFHEPIDHIRWFYFLACRARLSRLVQLKHGLRLRSASHVAHEEIPDADQVGGPRLLKPA